jgi:GNAT superfamily N-acetyltransferase
MVVDWWQEIWGDRMGDLEAFTRNFMVTLGGDDLPVNILAMQDGKPIGTAALKEYEMREIYPDYQHWLGSVYVKSDYRGQGVAARLAGRVVELARQRGIAQLYLQTVNMTGGLYAELGWKPIDRLTYKGDKTLVMVKSLA